MATGYAGAQVPHLVSQQQAGGLGQRGEAEGRGEFLFLVLTCTVLRANKATAAMKWSHYICLISPALLLPIVSLSFGIF